MIRTRRLGGDMAETSHISRRHKAKSLILLDKRRHGGDAAETRRCTDKPLISLAETCRRRRGDASYIAVRGRFAAPRVRPAPYAYCFLTQWPSKHRQEVWTDCPYERTISASLDTSSALRREVRLG